MSLCFSTMLGFSLNCVICVQTASHNTGRHSRVIRASIPFLARDDLGAPRRTTLTRQMLLTRADITRTMLYMSLAVRVLFVARPKHKLGSYGYMMMCRHEDGMTKSEASLSMFTIDSYNLDVIKVQSVLTESTYYRRKTKEKQRKKSHVGKHCFVLRAATRKGFPSGSYTEG